MSFRYRLFRVRIHLAEPLVHALADPHRQGMLGTVRGICIDHNLATSNEDVLDQSFLLINVDGGGNDEGVLWARLRALKRGEFSFLEHRCLLSHKDLHERCYHVCRAHSCGGRGCNRKGRLISEIDKGRFAFLRKMYAFF